MKKSRIIIIAILVSVVFVALISILISYSARVTNMRKEQFDAGVTRSLFRVSRTMEMEETFKGLKEDLRSIGSQEIEDSLGSDPIAGMRLLSDSIPSDKPTPQQRCQGLVSHSGNQQNGLTLGKRPRSHRFEFSGEMRNELKKRYIYQQELLNKVVYSILYSSNETPLEERINFKNLDTYLNAELANNGINIPYHFMVTNGDGRVLYQCPDYTDEGNDHSYKQVLMPNNSPSNTGILTVSFPSISRYIYKSVRYIIVAVLFIIILVFMYIYMVRMVLRQGRLSEMKNDFVNNMTHELKTPVASISLASQMLTDKTITKSEQMTEHLSSVIRDETKRLQRLIDRVLQTSLLEGKRMALKHDDLDINTMVEDVVSTFALKVGNKGGSIQTHLKADNSHVLGDEVHITNVLFNLMENAVKYRREEEPLKLVVSTECKHNNLIITIADNGMGIKKEDLKKIFEKFYRIHSGNKHDVKGFGLGLAYVRNIILLHHGHIHAESELGRGTKFIISLPLIKD